MDQASARLRRTFAYPDEETESLPEALDEEEQERLIEALAAQNTTHNHTFTTLLLALPLLSTIPYLRLLLTSPTLSLLALTSLFSTAYLVRTLPPGETGLASLDRWINPSHDTDTTATGKVQSRGVLSTGDETTEKSPMERYLPYLTLVLTTLLVLHGLVATGPKYEGKVWLIGLGNLPAVVFGVVLVAKVVMGGVDPERELGGLRYEYKGA